MVQMHVTPESVAADAEAEAPPVIEIPEQFRNEDGSANLEALLKSQADGQAEVTRLQQGATKAPAEETPPPTGDEAPAGQPAAVQAASAEYAEKGELSEATYEKLAGQGLTKDIVDGYIGGQIAKQQQFATTLYTAAGGEDSYGKMMAWGGENLSEAEQGEFDAALKSGQAGAKAAVTNLFNRFKAEGEFEPAPLDGDTGGGGDGGEYFKSPQELVAAMSDPKYRRDAAFRADVDRKMANSEKRGIKLVSTSQR